MSDPLALSPDEIADSAVAAASEAFDSVKAFTTGIASDRIHAASLTLHDAGSVSTSRPSDEATALALERAVRLHPLVTVWAVGAGLVVGGLLGAFLVVPLVAIAEASGSRHRSRSSTRQLSPQSPP
jgi:hypothetical protein